MKKFVVALDLAYLSLLTKLFEFQETKTNRTYEEERPDIGESMQKDAVRAVREIHAVS